MSDYALFCINWINPLCQLYAATLTIDSFQQLFDMTAPDFAPVYERVKALPELAADAVMENETLHPA